MNNSVIHCPKLCLKAFLMARYLVEKIYTNEDKSKLEKDTQNIYVKNVQLHPRQGEKEIILTAGAPGAGKTEALLKDCYKNGKETVRLSAI